jgi:hypothetical protein
LISWANFSTLATQNKAKNWNILWQMPGEKLYLFVKEKRCKSLSFEEISPLFDCPQKAVAMLLLGFRVRCKVLKDCQQRMLNLLSDAGCLRKLKGKTKHCDWESWFLGSQHLRYFQIATYFSILQLVSEDLRSIICRMQGIVVQLLICSR